MIEVMTVSLWYVNDCGGDDGDGDGDGDRGDGGCGYNRASDDNDHGEGDEEYICTYVRTYART